MALGERNFGLLNPYLAAIDACDLDRLVDCFAEGVEFQLAETTPVLVGKEALRQFFLARWQSFAHQKAFLRRSFTNGLEIITVAEIQVTIPELGEGLFILPIAQHFMFDALGLITKLTDYLDIKSAVRIPVE
nr:nuclear transport factor 2 family protein [uncultured Holophaga sp.]